MNASRTGIAGLMLTFAAIAAAQSPAKPTLEQLQKRAADRIPTEQQLRYQEIPWVHDIAEALQVAKTENRPMFVWGYGGRGRPDNGLEGC